MKTLLCIRALVLSLISLPLLNLPAQTAPISQAEAHSRAEELLKQMTVDEKIGQMNQVSGVVMPMLASEMPGRPGIAGGLAGFS